MLVNDWGGGQQLEDDGTKEVFSSLEKTKTVDYKEKDQKKAQATNPKAEPLNPVFDNNENGKEEIPSTLDEGKTGNVKRKRI